MFTKVRKDLSVRIVLVLMFIFGCFDIIPAHASTIIHHVKWDVSGANNGTSWAVLLATVKDQFLFPNRKEALAKVFHIHKQFE